MWSCALLSCWAALPHISCRRHRKRIFFSFFIVLQTHFTFEAKNKTKIILMNKQFFLIFWCLYKDPLTVPRRNVKTQLYLLRLGPTSTLVRGENRASRKRLSNRRIWRRRLFVLVWTENVAFPKRLRHVISLTEFSPDTNLKWPVIVAFSTFFWCGRKTEWNLHFQNYLALFEQRLSFHFIKCILKWLWRQDHLRECLQAVDFGLTLRIN